jgi:hypothetical protein
MGWYSPRQVGGWRIESSCSNVGRPKTAERSDMLERKVTRLGLAVKYYAGDLNEIASVKRDQSFDVGGLGS